MTRRSLHAVMLPAGARLYEMLAAALDGSGPALLPLSPGQPAARLRAMLAALRPTAVMDAEGIRTYDSAATIGEDVAVVVATSGSTGDAKGVELSAAALTYAARASLSRLGASDERWLCCLPVDHIAGLQVLVRSLVVGSDPVVHQRFDVASVAASQARYVSLVPTQLRRLIERQVDLSTFSVILLGGAAPSTTLLAEAKALGGRVVATYGMTETCGGCVYDGEPLDGVCTAVDDEGRIRIAGPVLFERYRLRPDLTAACRDGDWFITPDLGRLRNGRLLVTGRGDDVINTGGEKVVAITVAEALASHGSVSDVVVVGRPDHEWGERVTAVVVPSDPACPPTLSELRAYARDRLPAHALPSDLRLVEKIPLLSSGKVDRAAVHRIVRQDSSGSREQSR